MLEIRRLAENGYLLCRIRVLLLEEPPDYGQASAACCQPAQAALLTSKHLEVSTNTQAA